MIIRPTIASLRDLLDRLSETGWNEHQQIQIKQMANAAEIFSVEAVEVWIGAES
jgi:phenylacetate-coenzyme A ligase PaaK-like adenylate-forming protein